VQPQYFDNSQDDASGDRLSEGPRVLSVANQKGGVGKTTTAVNLATALAACKKRVLVIDMDPQGNASTGLGVAPDRRARSIYHVLMDGTPIKDVVIDTVVPGMSVVPSGVDLSGAELELVNSDRREYRLRDGLEALFGAYDYVLIDCPPALGLLTLNAFVASDAVLVPLQAEFYALEGLSHLLRTVERVKRGLNPKLEIQGIVLTMFDRRNNLCDMVAADVRKHLGDVVYDTMIPRNVRVSEAPSHGKPVLLYDMNCAGSQSYIRLAGEILRREKTQSANGSGLPHSSSIAGSRGTRFGEGVSARSVTSGGVASDTTGPAAMDRVTLQERVKAVPTQDVLRSEEQKPVAAALASRSFAVAMPRLVRPEPGLPSQAR
jgi:chromosome partitioning protein